MNKHISRRGFLRGAGGAVLTLPWLEAFAVAGPSAAPAKRLAVFYVPIGVVRSGFFPGERDIPIPKFTGPIVPPVESKVKKTGWHDLPITPTLEPLKAIHNKLTLITGMDRQFQFGTDVHAQCASCFLSSAAPNQNDIKHSAWPLDRTFDHIVADHIGAGTPLPTLELSCNSHTDNKESIYFDNISWYGTGHVAPSLRDPRVAYDRMFRTQHNANSKAITDLVLADARAMRRDLGQADRDKFNEYFEAVRTIEQRIDRMQAMRSELAQADIDEPTASRLPRGEYIQLMGDLMVVALQTGLTRVATMMVGPERWDTPYMFDGLFDKPMSHHQMSHNQNKFTDHLLKVDRFHMEQFAYVVQKMDRVVESDGSTLLDNTLLTYGSGLGDGATHQYSDLPIIVAGGKNLGLRTGRHLHCADQTPLANLWLTQARAMGLEREQFADSTGLLEPLFA